MAISTKVLVASAAGLAALGLVGAGAGAAFTDSASASGSITTGTVNVQLASSVNGAYSDTLNLGQLGNQGSSFSTGTDIFLKDVGSLDLKRLDVTLTAGGSNNDPDSVLASNINVSLTIAGHTYPVGTLASLEQHGSYSITGIDLTPNQAYGGHITLTATNLPSTAQGRTINPVLTVTGSDA